MSSETSLDSQLGESADTPATLTARIDSLTDAVVTLRSFVNERMGDVGDTVSRSQTQISRELEQAFGRVQSQTTQQLNEALLEARIQMTRDLEEAAAEAQDKLVRQIGAALDRLESQANRRTANDERRHDQAAAALQTAAATGEDGARRIEHVATAISTDLATSHQMADKVMAAIEATGRESRERSVRVGADIGALSESVADALTQVADRLEQLADINHGQQDLVEAVAQALDDVAVRLDDLDSSNRSRHERVIAAVADLRSKRGQASPVDLEPVTSGLQRVETFVEALVDAADDVASTEKAGLTAAVERLSSLESTIADQFNEATTNAVRTLTEAADQAANQINSAEPQTPEVSTLAAMTRIEGRIAEMTRQREEQDQATQEMLDSLEDTVSRLASAQAEDLERILDTVENAPAGDTPSPPLALSLSAPDAQRLARIEEELRKISRQPKSAIVAADVDDTALERMAALGDQIEALRRRMAVRARPETPALDPSALEAIADAVAAKLTAAGDRPATSAPARRKTSAKKRMAPAKGTTGQATTAKRTTGRAPTTERTGTGPRNPRSQA